MMEAASLFKPNTSTLYIIFRRLARHDRQRETKSARVEHQAQEEQSAKKDLVLRSKGRH